MRVLILSAILACVAAAPSGIVAPILKSELVAPVAAVPVAKLATVDSGDVEAEVINAKVAAEDAAIAAADRARLLSELAVVDAKDKTQVVVDQVKEKQEEAFWSVEDQKWRYLDAVNTAEAKLDGAIARDANILAKSTLGGVILAPIVPPIAPIVAPVAPILASRSGIVAPILYSAPTILKTEEKKEDMKMGENMDDTIIVKSTHINEELKKSAEMLNEELKKSAEMLNEQWRKSTEMINEELKIKMAALEKNLEAKPAIFAPTLWSAPVVAPYKLTEPWLTQVYVPGASYSGLSSLHAVPSLLPSVPAPIKLA